MTIYSSKKAPDWDKSGEKRIAMPPEMRRRYTCATLADLVRYGVKLAPEPVPARLTIAIRKKRK